MAERRALHIIGGEVKETPTGDTVYGASGSGQAYQLVWTFREGGSVLAGNIWAVQRIPVSGTITRVTIVADQSDTLECEIQTTSFASAVGGFGSIVGAGHEPGLSAAQKYEDATLTDWTTAVTAGDLIRAYVAASPVPGSATVVSLIVEVTPS
jgi:hypothetical protein